MELFNDELFYYHIQTDGEWNDGMVTTHKEYRHGTYNCYWLDGVGNVYQSFTVNKRVA